MTLTEILALIQQHPIPELVVTELGNNRRRIQNLNELRDAIVPLAAIPALNAHLATIIQHPAFSFIGDPVFHLVEADNFAGALSSARIAVKNIARFLAELLPASPAESVRVKLPPSADYRGVVEAQETLLKILEQLFLINPDLNARIQIVGWENGSLWLTLSVGGAIVVGLVGRAVWAAVVIRNKFHQGSILKEHARRMEIENSFLEHVSTKTKELVDAVVESEALAIYDQYLSGERKPEEIERVKHTLRELAEFIDRGAEIHPALAAPESSVNLFPNFKQLDTVTSQIKQLEDSPPPASEGI